MYVAGLLCSTLSIITMFFGLTKWTFFLIHVGEPVFSPMSTINLFSNFHEIRTRTLPNVTKLTLKGLEVATINCMAILSLTLHETCA